MKAELPCSAFQPTRIDGLLAIFDVLPRAIEGREMYKTWQEITVMLESGVNITPAIADLSPHEELEMGWEAMASGGQRHPRLAKHELS